MIDEDNKPFIEMTDDGRHLNYFPEGFKDSTGDGFDKISRGNKRLNRRTRKNKKVELYSDITCQVIQEQKV